MSDTQCGTWRSTVNLGLVLACICLVSSSQFEALPSKYLKRLSHVQAFRVSKQVASCAAVQQAVARNCWISCCSLSVPRQRHRCTAMVMRKLEVHQSPDQSNTRQQKQLPNAPVPRIRRPFPTHLLVFGSFACGLLFWFAFERRSFQGGRDSHHHHATMAHDHHAHMGGMDDGGDMDMSMPMYFINSWHTTLWFKSWETTNGISYALSLLGLVLLGILHEAVAVYRTYYLSGGCGEQGGMLQEPLVGVANPRLQKPRNSLHERVCLSLLYMLNLTTGYFLMLAVMTFNVGVFIAVLLGMGLGYFLLFDMATKGSLTRMDSCHPRQSETNNGL